MKQAVLYVGHGSRVKEAQDKAISFMRSCMPLVEADIQEICFLELNEPYIEEGFEICVKKGATHIAIVPLLLLTAVHAKSDIPVEIEKVKKRFPQVKVTYGRPIGVNQEVTKAVVVRIEEAGYRGERARILLVGRGSSDPDVKRDVFGIADDVRSMLPRTEVLPCFITACEPNYRDVLAQLTLDEHKPVYIIPYLLFTGILMKEIESEVDQARERLQDVRLCRYIGFHPHVKAAYMERVKETILNKEDVFRFQGEGHASNQS
ncbi:sirohydrochlorin chelatase [Bacillus sp. FJAT-53060]|uniref:sirohydrochlorin chelatase n=1 Tax=Bacillus TaxID=1386 RepID=UPI001CFA33B0|nr:sirohydrochlorin chelatase [Bacillus stratosphericus]